MFHNEDWEGDPLNHVLTINLVDGEEHVCEEIIMALYREGTISANDVADRLKEVSRRIKDIRDQVCELHNIAEQGKPDCI